MARKLDVVYSGCLNSPHSIFRILFKRKLSGHWKDNLLDIHSLWSGTVFPSQSCKLDQIGTENCESLIRYWDNWVIAVCIYSHLPTCMTLQYRFKKPHGFKVQISNLRIFENSSCVCKSDLALVHMHYDTDVTMHSYGTLWVFLRTLASSDPKRNLFFCWMMLSNSMLQ